MSVPLCLGECALSNQCCLSVGKPGWDGIQLGSPSCYLFRHGYSQCLELLAEGRGGGQAAGVMLPFEMAFLVGGPSILSYSFISGLFPLPLSLCWQSGWQETFLGSGVDSVGITADTLLLKGCQPE